MAALPEDVLTAWQDRDGPAILATTDADGTPNVIYVTCVSAFGNNRLVVADNYFDKTRKNFLRGGKGAMLFRSKTGKAYQVKGTLEYYSEGGVFEDMKRWNPEKHPGHAAAALRVETVYSGAQKLC